MRFGIVKKTTDPDKEIKDDVKYPEPLGKDEYHKIEAALGYTFKDISWLERALTHRSAPAKGTSSRKDYERLEFLGDAVLDLAVSDFLLGCHPDANEGECSKMRASLVNENWLAEIAQRIDLGPYIKLGRGELSSGGAERPSILSDVMEAVIGAVYRDASFEQAKECIERLYGDDFMTVNPSDPKTELQEELHAAGSEPPSYLLECTEGPEHSPTFVSVVVVDGQIVGRGSGRTKKASQQEAASEALTRLRKNDDIDDAFTVTPATPNEEEDAEEAGVEAKE